MIESKISEKAVNRAHLISRLAAASLTLVLVIVTVFAMWGSVATRDESERAKILFTLSDRFQIARYYVAEEEAARNAYDLAPSASIRARHDGAAKAIEDALSSVGDVGGSVLRTVDAEVLLEQRRYVAANRRAFDALDRNDRAAFERQNRTSVVPAFKRISRQIDHSSAALHVLAVGALDALSRTQSQVTQTTRSVSVVGIVLLGIFLLIFRTYKRRIDEAIRTELIRLEQAGFKDNLTGLGNHRAYQDAINREIARSERTGEAFSLALLDIDEFKFVNDRSGHAHGDFILTTLARLLGETRAGDVAYRLGGDEFALLLANTSLADAATAMQRLREQAQRRLLGSTLSIGIANLAPGRHASSALKEQADAALYEAKRRGRNLVVTVEELDDIDPILSSTKMQALRRFLHEGTVQAVFQPIWDIRTGGVLGLEALARLPADCGLDGPQEAFDIAEKIGRAHDLDALCRNAVLARASELPRDTLLFLNVSPQSLDHDNLAGDALVDAVRAVGLDPERVVLELTERSLARPHVVIREARRLQTLGFRLALDDTGAGNSGLEVLSRLSVDFVKIDRGVIVAAMTDRSARGVLAGIVAIAQQTEAYVIAEGLEDEGMYRLVCDASNRTTHAFGVQGAQGYLFGRPVADIDDAMRLPVEAPPIGTGMLTALRSA